MKEYPQRTTLQNAAFHLGCRLEAEKLNDAGFDQKKVLPKLPKILDTVWTMEAVKAIYKILIKAMYGYDSTRQCTTQELSDAWEKLQSILIDVCGEEIRTEFPSEEQTKAYLESFKK